MHTNLDLVYVNNTIERNPPLELELMLVASLNQFFVNCRVAIRTAVHQHFVLRSFSAILWLNPFNRVLRLGTEARD